jgi:hypothetical protein
VPAALHRDDRLGAAHAAGQPGELARVAEALQVQQHHLGAGVGGPVLQQVVAADVGAVARRDEAGQADVAVARLLEQRRAERTGLREEADPAAAGHPGRQAGVEPHRRVGVDDAQAVGPDHPHARGARRGDQLPLAARPSGPDSPKPPEMTTSPWTRLRRQASTTAATSSAGTATTARSTSSGTSSMPA